MRRYFGLLESGTLHRTLSFLFLKFTLEIRAVNCGSFSDYIAS